MWLTLHFGNVFSCSCSCKLPLPWQTLWLEPLVFTQEWNLLQFSFYLFALFCCWPSARLSTQCPMSHVPGPFPYYFIVGQQNVPHAMIIRGSLMWLWVYLWLWLWSFDHLSVHFASIFDLKSPTVSHVPSRVRFHFAANSKVILITWINWNNATSEKENVLVSRISTYC